MFPCQRRCPSTSSGQCPVTDAFFRSAPPGTGTSGKCTCTKTRRKRPHVGRPGPKACGHRWGRCGHGRHDVARQQRQRWEAIATLTPKDKGAMRAQPLLGRHGRQGQPERGRPRSDCASSARRAGCTAAHTGPEWCPQAPRPRAHPQGQPYGSLWATSGKPPGVPCGHATLPEPWPDVALTAATYRKLKHEE